MLFDPKPPASEGALTVTGLNRRIKALLEETPDLQRVRVKGEIGSLKKHTSGHWYFNLKDDVSQISAVMFRAQVARNPYQDFREGDLVVAHGSVMVYEARGQYQLLVEKMTPAGLGELYRRFERLKAQLAEEGLFDPSRKRPLPAFPRTVALITSASGAVLHDIHRTLQRRGWPLHLVVVPATVQGVEALPTLLRALQQAQAVPGVEAIVFARGGGSIEDLWCFNEEALARAVAASPVPVVSAIGHETDFTILDFVADLRASTPTAAAELLAPEKLAWLQYLDELQQQLGHYLLTGVRHHRRDLQLLHTQLGQALQRPLFHARQDYQQLHFRLAAHMRQQLSHARVELAAAQATLTGLDVREVLQRGYALVEDSAGNRVTSSQLLANSQQLTVRLKDGAFNARVVAGDNQ